MKSRIYIFFCLVCLSCTSESNEFFIRGENDSSGIAINELKDIECSLDGRKVAFMESNDFTATDFGSLTMIGEGDSVYFNIEKFRVDRTDTLRVGNFGGRTIPKMGASTIIGETICLFLMK